MRINIILSAIILILWNLAQSQNIGVGIGYTSAGRTTSKINLTDIHSAGIYIRYANECPALKDKDYGQIIGTSHNELVFGCIYRVHPSVSIQAGGGRWKQTTDYACQNNHIESEMITGYTVEGGFIVNLIKWEWGGLLLDATINNYSGVCSIVVVNIKIVR